MKGSWWHRWVSESVAFESHLVQHVGTRWAPPARQPAHNARGGANVAATSTADGQRCGRLRGRSAHITGTDALRHVLAYAHTLPSTHSLRCAPSDALPPAHIVSGRQVKSLASSQVKSSRSCVLPPVHSLWRTRSAVLPSGALAMLCILRLTHSLHIVGAGHRLRRRPEWLAERDLLNGQPDAQVGVERLCPRRPRCPLSPVPIGRSDDQPCVCMCVAPD